MASFIIEAVLACDDIRTEHNGKQILIGVYGGDIIVPAAPTVIALAFWIELLPKQTGTYGFDLRFEVPGPDPQPEILGITAQAETLTAGVLAIPPQPFLIQRDGELRVLTREGGSKRWKMVKQKRICVAPQSAVPPPS